MATEAKPFASLSSGLLARKGAARPAMRPQGFGQLAGGLEDLGWNDMGLEAPKPAALVPDGEASKLSDPVAEHPRVHPTGLTPVQSPVHNQQAQLADRLNGFDEEEEAQLASEVAVPEPEPVRKREKVTAIPAASVAAATNTNRQVRAAPGSKGKAAFTLRLDPERHLKLRLACAVDGRSAQQLVTTALDQFLERMPEVDGLAAKAKRRG